MTLSVKQGTKQPRQVACPTPRKKIRHFWQHITRSYPFLAQQSVSDCGIACLVMISCYWGKHFSLNRLRDIANVDRNGSSLLGLCSAAEAIGLLASPVKADLTQLAAQTLPAIAHWEGNHYVVVYSITKKHVFISDPAIGQKKLSHNEFNKGWTGYALLVEPTALFQKISNDKQTLQQFQKLLKPYKVVLVEIFIVSVLIQIFSLLTSHFTKQLVDGLGKNSSFSIVPIGFGLLIFALFRVVMHGLRQYLLDSTASKVDLALISKFISHALHLPLSFFESRNVGDIISRVQENHKIQRFLTGESLSIILDLLTLFIYLGLMFWYSWKMALFSLIVIPPLILLTLLSAPILQRISREIFSVGAKETGYLIQSFTGIRTVKSSAIEQKVQSHWEKLFDQTLNKILSGKLISNLLQSLSATVETLMSTGLLCFGAWLVIQKDLTLGQLIAFQMLLGSIIGPFQRLTLVWNQLQEVFIAVERINDVLENQPEEDAEHEFRQPLPLIQGHIQFDRVTFRYHPESESNTLTNINFEVKAGQMVAIVGQSGSGKSTLSKLLLGLYPPTEGKILVDGFDLKDLKLQSLRQQIGVVDQDTFLFGGTIRENITIGDPQSSLKEVIRASKLAGAHTFIQNLPMGYETQIGEAGGLFSSGQRQRIAIARALLGNPRLLIFDEATSHLDAESERIIQSNLIEIVKGRTAFVIAHRLSTIRNADLILVLDGGVLAESGTHETLMNKRGRYFHLNQQQFTIPD
jgi:HlyB family type I secretion system ABC transporter